MVSNYCHRRKVFVLGLIIAASSARDLVEVLSAEVYPLSYFLIYKFSQDNLELLFACIRGKNGFNNNPDQRPFKSALKKILLRVSIVGSRYSNCLTFENEFISLVYFLKWNRKKTSFVEYDAVPDLDFKYQDLQRFLKFLFVETAVIRKSILLKESSRSCDITF